MNDMTFRYEKATDTLSDDQAGILIRRGGGRTEIDSYSFRFIDPHSNVVPLGSSNKKPGEFVFYAKPVRRIDRVRRPDGSHGITEHLLGFELENAPLRRLFEGYTRGDPVRYAEVCSLIGEGLRT